MFLQNRQIYYYYYYCFVSADRQKSTFFCFFFYASLRGTTRSPPRYPSRESGDDTHWTLRKTMTSHQSTAVQVMNSSESGGGDDDDEQLPVDCAPTNFQWTMRPEKTLLFNMIRLKPSGINKHLSMLLLREKVSQELKLNIPTKFIWRYLKTKWDIDAADVIEHVSFNTNKKHFDLPEEYEQLIYEEIEELKKSREKCLNDEISKKKLLNYPGKTRSKSNSMSSLDYKDDFNENVSSKITFEDVTSTRRSLRINENLDEIEFENDSLNKKKSLRANNKLDNRNKSTNSSKLLINKPSYQLKHNEHKEKISKVIIIGNRKRKIRTVSESSSDNSKQTRSYKNNFTDKTVSDSPRSVTQETISRKSNLRSSDKDLKSTAQTVDKSCLKYGHTVNLILPELIERLKPADKIEKQFSNILDMKSIQSSTNKNESHIKLKGKIRNRVTSDLLVALQNPEVQSLGRRSCNKS